MRSICGYGLANVHTAVSAQWARLMKKIWSHMTCICSKHFKYWIESVNWSNIYNPFHKLLIIVKDAIMAENERAFAWYTCCCIEIQRKRFRSKIAKSKLFLGVKRKSETLGVLEILEIHRRFSMSSSGNDLTSVAGEKILKTNIPHSLSISLP